MNRRQKIIVSVTGIFIVLLILIGLTYAYFLTRITGNGNQTSISVTTANLELVYGDGTTALLTSSAPIEPGKFSASKDFTVTNNGNALTDYAVTLEDFAVFYANDTVINGQQVKAGTVTKMEYPGDMEMEITCTIESDDDERNGTSCSNISKGMLPVENSILVTNDIEVGDTHKYVLTLTYVDSGIDQSKDMNKTIKGKIDIIDPKSTIDIRGTVETYEMGDYVEINSTPIKSEIVNGKYKLVGVEPGSHTLNIKYKDENGDIKTRGSQTLTIQKGEEASVFDNTITFTDASREATIQIQENYQLTINDMITNFTNIRDVYEQISGYYINTEGNISRNSTSVYVRIPVKEGEYWSVWYPKESNLSGAGKLRYEDSSKEKVAVLNMLTESDYKINIIKDSDVMGAVMKVPAGVSYMCVNLKSAVDYTERAFITKIDTDTKWTVLGDSLTDFNVTNVASMNYVELVSEELGIPVQNLGRSGTNYVQFSTRVQSISSDSNLITIFGSFNSLWDVPMGSATDEYVEGATNSHAAYINKTLDYIQTNYPDAKVAVLSPTPWGDYVPGSTGWDVALQYVSLLEEICEQKNIPFLDLFRNSELQPWDEENKAKYFLDAVHPNDEGHKIIASKIIPFLKEILEN